MSVRSLPTSGSGVDVWPLRAASSYRFTEVTAPPDVWYRYTPACASGVRKSDVSVRVRGVRFSS